MTIVETEIAAKKYALKILGLNENQIMSSEIVRQVENISQHFIAGAKWLEEIKRLRG